MSTRPTDAEYADFVASAWGPLYRTAYLMIGNHALAEDLVQTALTNTYASWRNVRELDAAYAYARTAVARSVASWFRSKVRLREQPTDRLPETSYAPDPSTRPMLLEALAQLPPRQRAAVVLRFYDDLNVAEVAHALGCSEGTVKSQTSAGLGKLRLLLGDSVIPSTEGPSFEKPSFGGVAS